MGNFISLKYIGLVLIVMGLCALLAFIFPHNAMAQKGEKDGKGDATISYPANDDEIYKVLATIDDTEVRRLLAEQLRQEALRKSSEAAEPAQDRIWEQTVVNLGERFRFALSGSNHLCQDLNTVLNNMTSGRGFPRLLLQIITALGVIAFGLLIEWFVRKKVIPYQSRLSHLAAETNLLRLKNILINFLFDFLYLIVFFLPVMFLTLFLKEISGPGIKLPIVILASFLIIRIGHIILLLIFSPYEPNLRFAILSDSAAAFIYRGAMILIIFYVFLSSFARLFKYFGGSESAFLLLRVLGGCFFFALLLCCIWLNLRRILRFKKSDPKPDGLPVTILNLEYASFFNATAMFYVLVVWSLWLFELLTGAKIAGRAGLFSLLLIPLFFALEGFGSRLLAMLLSAEPPENVAPIALEEADPQTTRSGRGGYWLVACWVWRVALFTAFSNILSNAWGFELPFKGTIGRPLFSITVSLMLAGLTWEYAKSFIEKQIEIGLNTSAIDSANQGQEATKATRLLTLLPLLRNAIAVTLCILVGMIILASIGVDIGPLLASAGVLGLAIGMGSKELVKDMIAGIFFLMDDAFRVGEWVTIGKAEGEVTKTSLRTLTLRHYKGQLELIPYGTVGNVTNWSRGPMLVKFTLKLPEETDPEKVRKLVKKVNQGLQADPAYGPYMVEPLKFQGVKNVEEGIMTIRLEFTARPGRQFEIRRAAFQQIHAELKKSGINFATKTVAVNYIQPVAIAMPSQTPPAENVSGDTSMPITEPAVAGAATLLTIDEP